jgi:hypothetical protein
MSRPFGQIQLVVVFTYELIYSLSASAINIGYPTTKFPFFTRSRLR